MGEKKAAGQFKGSESNLCGVSFDEDVPAGSWKRRLRYVPLAAPLTGVCAATGVDAWYKATHPAPQVPTPAVQASFFARTTPQSPPEVYVPIPHTDMGPWTPRVAGTTGYLPTDAAQVLLEQSMTDATVCVQGRDGRLFLSDVFNTNFSQAPGRMCPTPEQVSVRDRYMSGIETAANGQGATALFMPAPATRNIHSDKLSQQTDPLTGTTSLGLVCSVLPTHAWVDVYEGLREVHERSEVPPYSAVNPHRSPYAAHVVWNQMLSCLAAVNPQLRGLPSLTPSGVSSVDAPNEYEALGAPAQSGPWTVLTYEQNPGSVHLLQLEIRDDLIDTTAHLTEVTDAPEVSLASPVDFQNKPALTYNPDGCDTALIMHDSRGNNLELEVAITPEYTIQVSHGLDTEQSMDVATLIEAYKPSVMIMEFMLRYLVFTSTVGKQNRFPDHDRSDGSSHV